MKKLGENIKKARNIANLTAEELASLLGVTKVTVYRWESGEREPDLSTLRAIAIHLSVTFSMLLDGIDDGEIEDNEEMLKLKSRNINYWEEQAKKIQSLIFAESADAFAQVEDIYINEFNKRKKELYEKIDIASPDTQVYTFPYPNKIGGLLGRIYMSPKVPDIKPLGLEQHLGYRIKILREALSVSIEELADRLKLDPDTIWKWEHLQDAGDIPLPEVAKALNVSVELLFSPSHDNKQFPNELTDEDVNSKLQLISTKQKEIKESDQLIEAALHLNTSIKELGGDLTDKEAETLSSMLELCIETLKNEVKKDTDIKSAKTA